MTKHVAHSSRSLIFPWNRKLLHLSTKFISSVKKKPSKTHEELRPGNTLDTKFFILRVNKSYWSGLKTLCSDGWTFKLKNWVSDDYVVLCKTTYSVVSFHFNFFTTIIFIFLNVFNSVRTINFRAFLHYIPVKSSFSEKTTKIWKILPLDLMLLSKNSCFFNTGGIFFLNFEAFS